MVRGSALVIEDEIFVAWSILEQLEDYGFAPVVVATTDNAASEAALTSAYSLIVCDLDLGSNSVSGFDILEDIDPEGKFPTVIYSAIDPSIVGGTLELRRPRAVFLHKPASASEFRLALACCLEQRNKGQVGGASRAAATAIDRAKHRG
jgi:DNA-binding NtrC family response regulator